MARTQKPIPSVDFKRFFSVRKVQQMYPNLTTRQAEKLKNYFCNTTLHYVAILQGYLKPFEYYSHTLDGGIRHIINDLKQQQQQNSSHYEFYDFFIEELNYYKELHDDNALDNYTLHSYLQTLYDYVHNRYNTE